MTQDELIAAEAEALIESEDRRSLVAQDWADESLPVVYIRTDGEAPYGRPDGVMALFVDLDEPGPGAGDVDEFGLAY